MSPPSRLSFRSMKKEEPIVVPDEKKKKKVTHGYSAYTKVNALRII
jgi:hypothetical protein